MIAIFRSDKLLSKSLDKDFAGLNSLESTRLPSFQLFADLVHEIELKVAGQIYDLQKN